MQVSFRFSLTAKGDKRVFCSRFPDLTTSKYYNSHFVCSGTGKASTGIIARKYRYHPVDYGEYEYFEGKVKSQ